MSNVQKKQEVLLPFMKAWLKMGCGKVCTPTKSNYLPLFALENQWLVQMYFLLKNPVTKETVAHLQTHLQGPITSITPFIMIGSGLQLV